jgi:hypothetical protein
MTLEQALEKCAKELREQSDMRELNRLAAKYHWILVHEEDL